MTDDMKETPNKVEKEPSSHEDATVFSARDTAEKKPKTAPATKPEAEKISEPAVPVEAPEPALPVVKSEPIKTPPPPLQSSQSSGMNAAQDDKKRKVLIIVIVAIVLICCCCAAIIGVYLASGGWETVQNLLGEVSRLPTSALC